MSATSDDDRPGGPATRDEESLPPPPPPIPLPEMPAEALSALIDEGNLEGVERALRQQLVRLPSVLRELDRVLDAGLGNLAAALATMLIGHFHVSQANMLAERVLTQRTTAGIDELVDLAAALIQQERLRAARSVLDAALDRHAAHDRGLYLSARLHGRKGRLDQAFETIAKVNPKVLGPHGLAYQARYAALTGRDKGYKGAIKLASKGADDDETRRFVQAVQQISQRADALGLANAGLREAMVIEYGAVLVELAADTSDHGRFDMEPISYRDAGRLIRKLAGIIESITPQVQEFLYASEHGEVVAAGLSQILGRPHRAWRRELNAKDGDWLCMGSAAGHPHLPNEDVMALDRALNEGTLRSVALVLPAGWRAPIVPDVLGRLTTDDEFPWAVDDEIDDIYEAIVADDPGDDLVRDDTDALKGFLARCRPHLRACQPTPRPGHMPFVDETPIPRRADA